MALSTTPISGPLGIDLGMWQRDCAKLRVKVIPPTPPTGLKNTNPPNTVSFMVSGGLPGASVLGLIASQVDEKKQKSLDESLSKTIPGFTGFVVIQLQAQPIVKACHEDEGKKVQKVGWAYYVKVVVEGKASTGVLAGGGQLSLSLGPFSPTYDKPCPCVEGVEPKLAATFSANGPIFTYNDDATGIAEYTGLALAYLNEEPFTVFKGEKAKMLDELITKQKIGSTDIVLETREIDGITWAKLPAT